MRENKFGNLNFVILDKYNFCQAAIEHQLLNLNRNESVKISVEL